MKITPFLIAAATGFWLLTTPGSASAQSTYTLDPVDNLTDAISLAEWNTPGDAEGWVPNQLESPAIPGDPVTVAGGLLTGNTTGIDSFLTRNPFAIPYATGSLSLVTIEVRLRRASSDTTPFQIYYSDAAGGFAEVRSATTSLIPADGAFHTVRLNIRSVANAPLSTQLRGLRIDPSRASGSLLELDYVRLKVASARIQTDPVQRINLYTSLGEWNNAGDFQSWVPSVQVTGLTAASGLLSGGTNGTDPQLSRTALGAFNLNTANTPIVEFRMRKALGDTSRIDLFWADTSGGFGGPRVTTNGTTAGDGQFHVYQARLAEFLNGNITSLRFDPVADTTALRSFDLDYIRFGSIEADSDNDGLADAAESSTGVFVSSRDTGTKPGVADTDSDGFTDGVEVAFGSDPNSNASFPNPAISSYTLFPATYLRNNAITANAPTVINGTPISYSIAPALPSGLSFNPMTGVISGTPTILSPATAYAVTATFSGGVTNTFSLTIDVRDPGLVGYTTNPASYATSAPITNNAPVLFATPPDSYAIAPALPDGLFLDPTSGIISGTPTTVSAATLYTITATYASSPPATTTLSLSVRQNPVFLSTDGPPMINYASLGEWVTGLDGWTFVNGNAASNLSDPGFLTYNATAPDPQMIRAGLTIDPASTGTLLEIRLSQNDSAVVEIFWADASGGIAGTRRTTIPSANIIADGQFHTYQIRFDGVFTGNLTQLRLDPGTIGGRSVIFDYVRIGQIPPAVDPVFTEITYDTVFREATIRWTSTTGRTYTLQATSDPGVDGAWTDIAIGIPGETGTTGYFDGSIPPGTTRRFYRIKP